MTRSRAGSAILLCLALATIAVIVGYAFLRAATRHDMSGRAEVLVALARDAAQSGLTHATEQILADYTDTTLTIADHSGIQTVSPPPTFLDGRYRAPFVSYTRTNMLANSQWGDPDESNDVPEENHLLMPLVRKLDDDGTERWHNLGCSIYDGRGRYIEVNYHNITRPSPALSPPQPAVPVRFTDPAATSPERDDGLFLDENLHRIEGGTPASNRALARFRVRYAVGVEDLEGHLLSNPLGDMNADWKDSANDYRGFEMVHPSTGLATTAAPAILRPTRPWLETAANAWHNMSGSYLGTPSARLRMEHVFRGRGSTSNTDRRALGPRQGLPASFPMMFRTAYDDGRIPSLFAYGVAGRENPAGRLFEWTTGKYMTTTSRCAPIAANPAGGEIITPIEHSDNRTDYHYPRAHALIGPQASWYTQYAAMMGAIRAIDGQAQTANDGNYLLWGVRRGLLQTLSTPFGRRLQASSASPETWKWYEGRVDTPWNVNVLTAAPQVVSQMLIAYMPPHLKKLHWTHEYFYPQVGVDGDGNPIYGPADATKTSTNGGAGWEGGSNDRDILTSLAAAGFSEFPAPTSNFGPAPHIVVNPDYYQDALETRPVAERYPGPLMRGDSTNPGEGSDDLGKDIDTSARRLGYCTHTGQPLLHLYGSDIIRYETIAGIHYRVIRRLDSSLFVHKDSYIWDLVEAMITALSYARATWVQYPNAVFDPTTGFTPISLRDPLAYDSLEELDRLFLRQLGENFDAPGTPCSDNPILVNAASGKFTFTVDVNPVSHTIKSLVDADLIKTASVSSAERAKVMERVLNDFRMSFFGASPGYSETFRPLDFDGDGNVHCSCYDLVLPLPTPDYKTSRWKAAVAGRGPALAPLTISDPASNVSPSPWFTVTGCFSIRKSHFYRVFVRGEVYDTFLRKPVAAQTLESVLVVDPEAPAVMVPGRNPAQTRTLFQRWHYNDSTSELPRQVR